MNETDKTLYVTALLEEYKSLRSEIRTKVDRQYPIIYWGISSISLVIAATIGSWKTLADTPGILSALFLLLIPAIITGFILPWSHIISEVVSIGLYVFSIEKKLARIFEVDGIYQFLKLSEGDVSDDSHGPIGWEHHLWMLGSHQLVNRTCNAALWFLAIVYLITLGIGYLLTVSFFWKQEVATQASIILFLFSAGLFWSAAWLKVYQSVRPKQLGSPVNVHLLSDR